MDKTVSPYEIRSFLDRRAVSPVDMCHCPHPLLSFSSVSYLWSQSCLPAPFSVITSFSTTPVYDLLLPLSNRSPVSFQLSYTSIPFNLSAFCTSTDLLGFPNRFSPLNVFPTSLLLHSLLMLGSCPANFQISSQQLTPCVFLVPTQPLWLACHSHGCYALCWTHF